MWGRVDKTPKLPARRVKALPSGAKEDIQIAEFNTLAQQQAANEQRRQEQAKLNSGGQWESGEPNRRKEKQGPVFDADVVNPKNPPSNDATKTPLPSLTTKTKTKTKVPYLNDSSKSTSKISLGVVFLSPLFVRRLLFCQAVKLCNLEILFGPRGESLNPTRW